jgi:hypothetical protein
MLCFDWVNYFIDFYPFIRYTYIKLYVLSFPWSMFTISSYYTQKNHKLTKTLTKPLKTMWASQLTRWKIILLTPALVNYRISSSSASFRNGGVSPRQKNYSRVVSTLEEIYGVNASCLSQGSRVTRVKTYNYKLIKNSKHLQEHVSLIPTTRENRQYFRADSLKWRSKMK